MSTALATQDGHALQPGQLNRDQIELLKTTICKGATDDELKLFLQVCQSKGLDPFTRQIHAVKRWNPSTKREEMTIQIGIDGFRLQAERSGLYRGQDGPYWCGEDGVWKDVWLSKEPPVAARIGIYREGFSAPIYRVAMYSEYVQLKDGGPNSMWKKMPASQLAKCVEGLCCRAAFPAELSGFYVPEEMGQADNDEPRQPVAHQPAIAIEPAPDKPWNSYKGMLAIFEELKEKGGEDLYYRVLRAHGAEHANTFKTTDDALKCWRELSSMVSRIVEVKP